MNENNNMYEYKGYEIHFRFNGISVYKNGIEVLDTDSISDAKAYVDIVTYKPE